MVRGVFAMMILGVMFVSGAIAILLMLFMLGLIGH